jgi:hypothetical protein
LRDLVIAVALRQCGTRGGQKHDGKKRAFHGCETRRFVRYWTEAKATARAFYGAGRVNNHRRLNDYGCSEITVRRFWAS